MKLTHLRRFSLFSLLMLAISCRPMIDKSTVLPGASDTMNQLQIPADFLFANAKDITFRIKVLNNQDRPMRSVPLSVYAMPDNQLLFTGTTQANGILEMQRSVGNHYTDIVIRTSFPGLPNQQTIPFKGTNLDITLGGSKPIVYGAGRVALRDPSQFSNALSTVDFSNASAEAALSLAGLPTPKTLGTWDSQGVPKYLVASDPIESQFYQDINASLPESSPLTKSHPEYLTNAAPTTIILKERCDVWITFVHEGAGWQNTLGFYTFDPANPPKGSSDVKTPTIIFPNVSFSGSGGGLVSGNKVKIGTFDAGIGIGFFLIANAFDNNKGQVGSGYYAHFSHNNLNTESPESLRRHVVVLDDPKSNRFLLAFEDVSRENKPINCDNDFNDVIFYATSNPVTAIDPGGIPKMDTAKDTDGDGVDDNKDEYPNDPKRAFNNYTPAQNSFGTLAYEDLWPGLGDYDFNDLVLNYNVQEIQNAASQVTELRMKVVVRAIGASFKNGWGFELPVSPSAIKSVTGNRINGKYISVAANKAESSSAKALVIGFDNAFDCIKRNSPEFINTVPGQTQSIGDTLTITVVFNNPISIPQTAPYNPFLIVNQERGREIHLSNYLPTEKADVKLLGSGHDRSRPSNGTYYKNENGLPWAMNFPVNFNYPIEKVPIIKSYMQFQNWAESGGTKYLDWYLDKTGYRNATNVFVK